MRKGIKQDKNNLHGKTKGAVLQCKNACLTLQNIRFYSARQAFLEQETTGFVTFWLCGCYAIGIFTKNIYTYLRSFQHSGRDRKRRTAKPYCPL